MSIVEILEQTLSPDQTLRMQATKHLEDAALSDLQMFMSALANELCNEANPEHARQAAGLQLKNQLTSKDEAHRAVQQQRWLQIDPIARAQIKQKLLLGLRSSSENVGATVAQAVAAVAQIELAQRQWEDLVPTMLQYATDSESPASLKKATLETIGYICEEIEPDVLQVYSNLILTAIINGMRKEETNNDVRLAATTALLNSLEFVRGNFNNEPERNYIMQVVCEATQCSDVQVVVRAMQCLVKVMSLYYHHMEYYMRQALFQLTLGAMSSNKDGVVLQAVEFWSTVCDEELELAMELQEAVDAGTTPQRVSKYYARGALKYLVPILTEILTRQQDTYDDDTWNESTAAGVCVALLALACEDSIVDEIMPFISENAANPDWHYREAAVLALGSILEGPSQERLTPICNDALVTLIGLMRDPSVHVKDTTAWTLGRICEFLPRVPLEHQGLQAMIEALIGGLDDVPRVAANVCWAFNTLSDAAHDEVANEDEEVPTYALSGYYEAIVEKLLRVTERHDGNENNLRSAAFEALMQLLQHSAQDTYSTVEKMTLIVLERLELVLHKTQGQSVPEYLMPAEVQSLLCATLQVVLRRLKAEHVQQLSQRVMTILTFMLSLSASHAQGSVQEDALMAISALIGAMDRQFLQYMDAFRPYLLLGLRNHQDHSACNLCVGVVGDLCRALTTDMLPYCDEIMQQLFSNLADPTLHQSIKPTILSAFGDIAIAIGPAVVKYIHHTLAVLERAAGTQIEGSNYELVEYRNQLHEGILDAYTGIIVGLKGDDPKTFNPTVYELKNFVPHVMGFIQRCAEDADHTDTVVRACVGLIGDFCEIFKSLMKPLVDQPWVVRLLKEGRASSNSNTRRTAEWATKLIREKCGQPGQ